MATPNYSYEKRQRELAKKRKTEEKRNRKANAGRDVTPADEQHAPAEGAAAPLGSTGSTGDTVSAG